MTVKELIEILKDLPEDREIVMSCDAEGNGYSPLADADPQRWYTPETTWSGDVHHPDDIESGEVELDESSKLVVLLWPTN